MDQKGKCRIDLIVGTRPNMVKLAPLVHALNAAEWCHPRTVFLEQHSGTDLSDRILDDLGVDTRQMLRIPLSTTDYGTRMGEMIASYDVHLREQSPHLVVVFGDVDATFSAALAAKRRSILVAHVEAGLRSNDRGMPEELNRLMVDSIADFFFATSEDAVDTLVQVEGKKKSSVHFVGNLMIDSLVSTVNADIGRAVCASLDVEPGRFAVATFHRPSNVDDATSLAEVVSFVEAASTRLPIVFPLHPRTSASLTRHGLRARLDADKRVRLLAPIGYRDFISMVSLARMVLTDSGGLQEETSYLGIPCVTVRENTERPITVILGTNRLASRTNSLAALDEVLRNSSPAIPSIPLWDGHTAGRITQVLAEWWHRPDTLNGN